MQILQSRLASFRPSRPLWELLGACRVSVRLGERFPCERQGAIEVVGADTMLDEALAPCRGRCFLLSPDRYVAAVFHHEDEYRTADRLAAQLGAESAPSVAASAVPRFPALEEASRGRRA